ncbi:MULTISPECIES: hypothetical protein [unclassified Leisingera]|nr:MULTISPECIES: hypothetical protein [unclassified Leisingera]
MVEPILQALAFAGRQAGGIPIGLYLFFLHAAGIPMPLGIFENLL